LPAFLPGGVIVISGLFTAGIRRKKFGIEIKRQTVIGMIELERVEVRHR